MIDLPLLASPSFVAPVAGASLATAGFRQALGAMLGGNAPPTASLSGDRQGAAEDGKPLPATHEDPDDAADATTWAGALPMAIGLPIASPFASAVVPPSSPADPAMTSIAVSGTAAASIPDKSVAPPPTPPLASAMRVGAGVAGDPPTPAVPEQVSVRATPVAALPPPPDAGAAATALSPQPAPRADASEARAVAPLDVRTASAFAGGVSALPVASPDVGAAAARAEPVAASPSVAPRALAPAIVVSTVAQPAHAVFAAAIAAASNWRERAPRDEAGTTPNAAPAPAPLDIAPYPVVRATGSASDVPLDLGSDRGLSQVIDRIETLRGDLHDAADARDTRVRLAPERLGTVDVSVRRDSDGVRVHFTAERETTQALLLDAQPRLAELAAQRGVRIAEASVSTGLPQPHHGPRPQPRTRAPMRASPPGEAPDTQTDTRLA